MDSQPPAMHEDNSERASTVVVDGVSGTATTQQLFIKKPIIILCVLIFAAAATALLLRTYAATTTVTKTWKTNSDWATGSQLDNVAVSGNAVALAVAKSPVDPADSSTDLARNHTSKASSIEARRYNAKKAFDNNLQTRWASQGGSGSQWVYVDLGSKYDISRVVLTWETAYAKTYKIQTSNDAKNWTDIYSTQSGKGGVDDLKSLTGNGRYVRMYASVRGTQWGYSLWDFQVYGGRSANTATTYQPTGTLTLTYDAGTTTKDVDWASIAAQTTKPAGTNITFAYATSADNKSWSGNTTDITKAANSRYLRITATLQTTNNSVTPTLNTLTLTYDVTTTPAAQPTVSLNTNPSTVNSGSAATLSWSSANATGCTASGGWSGSKATSGSASTGNLTATTTFTLTCSGQGGSKSASATVTVATTPPTTTSPSGAAMPGAISGYKQVCAEDFTKAAATGTWGTTDAGKIVYQGGCKWYSYPDGWPSTFTGGEVGYAPAKVLSVHDGVLDYSLQNVNGFAAGANPSPQLSSGSTYQTYGQYSYRAKFDKVSGYHVAWLLWPEDDADWQCGETDFPEFGTTDNSITSFVHHSCDGSQDIFNKQIDPTQWHTYTQTWTSSSRSFYVDGVLIGTSTKNVFKKPERLQLQVEPDGHKSGGTGHIQVDWVAIYAPN